MSIVDLVDRNGVLVGRDALNIKTEETLRDNYVMRIQDGNAVIHVYSVPFDTPVGMPHTDLIEEVYGNGAII